MYLKKATKEDLKTFYTMSIQKHIGKNLNTKSLEQFENEYKDDITTFLCVIRDGSIVGCIILVEEAETVQLKRIVIDEKNLGLVGSEVMQLVEEYCLRRLGKDRLWLDVLC